MHRHNVRGRQRILTARKSIYVAKGRQTRTMVLKAADPAQFTIEQISRVMKYIELPNAVRIQLEEHCQLRQNRSRMIASKKPLKLVKYEGPQDEPTPEERFGKKYKMR